MQRRASGLDAPACALPDVRNQGSHGREEPLLRAAQRLARPEGSRASAQAGAGLSTNTTNASRAVVAAGALLAVPLPPPTSPLY